VVFLDSRISSGFISPTVPISLVPTLLDVPTLVSAPISKLHHSYVILLARVPRRYDML